MSTLLPRAMAKPATLLLALRPEQSWQACAAPVTLAVFHAAIGQLSCASTFSCLPAVFSICFLLCFLECWHRQQGSCSVSLASQQLISAPGLTPLPSHHTPNSHFKTPLPWVHLLSSAASSNGRLLGTAAWHGRSFLLLEPAEPLPGPRTYSPSVRRFF